MCEITCFVTNQQKLFNSTGWVCVLPMNVCIHSAQLFLNVSKMIYFLIKHDLQVNNVASEICTEYGTKGIQNMNEKKQLLHIAKAVIGRDRLIFL